MKQMPVAVLHASHEASPEVAYFKLHYIFQGKMPDRGYKHRSLIYIGENYIQDEGLPFGK